MYPGCGCTTYRPATAELPARVPAVVPGAVIREPAPISRPASQPVRQAGRAYDDETRALHRVDILKRSGIWPAVIRRADGTAALTFDPPEVSR